MGEQTWYCPVFYSLTSQLHIFNNTCTCNLFFSSESPLLSIVEDNTTNSTITVTWSWPEDMESDITGFIVQYRLASSMDDFVNSTMIASNERMNVIEGLESGESYEVRILALSQSQPDMPLALSPQRVITTLGGKIFITLHFNTNINILIWIFAHLVSDLTIHAVSLLKSNWLQFIRCHWKGKHKELPMVWHLIHRIYNVLKKSTLTKFPNFLELIAL